ncbi:MAG: tetratricopeptide repeat protein [Longimicrobiales bacterium]
MSIESLKEKARKHEQKEEWKAALDLYLQAIKKLDEADQPDIGLYNRVADLEIRLGHVDRAADHYMASVDLYAEAELPNNAIAVCKKIIRNIPTRTDAHLRMGQIRASQGFLTDARQGFLTYAELKQTEGDLEEAFRALIEFADLAPDDTEVRLSLASQLHAHERTDEAVEQLLQARATLIVADEAEAVSEVEAMVAEMAPETTLPSPEEIREKALAASASPMEHGFEPDSLSLEGPEAAFGGEAADDAREEEPQAVEGLESTAVEGEQDDASEVAASDDIDLQGIAVAEEAVVQEVADDDGDAAEPIEIAASVDQDTEEEDAAEGLAELAELANAFDGADDVEIETVPLAEGEVADETELHDILDDWASDSTEEEETEDLPVMDFGSDDSSDDGAGLGDDWLTELTVHATDSAGSEESSTDGALSPAAMIADAEAPTAPATSPATLLEQGLAAMGAGQPTDGVPLLQQAYGELAQAGEFAQAMDALQALSAHDPDELEYHQRIVEYAFQVNDKSVLASAYLELARCLERTGDSTKARAVFQQVLGVDPENEAARAALGDAPEGETAPAVEVASSEDYVDLGSLVFDEEEDEKTTRWFVEMADPSGDDEADFAKMLTQFKAKVAEHLEVDDVRAHYDLGTAYREMGLVDEAIAEFQQALRGSAEHLPTYELLGQCFMEKGQYEVAIRSMTKALSAPYEVEDELMGIYYYLGRAHEEIGGPDQATEFYEKIFALDINFRDVTERLRALR